MIRALWFEKNASRKTTEQQGAVAAHPRWKMFIVVAWARTCCSHHRTLPRRPLFSAPVSVGGEVAVLGRLRRPLLLARDDLRPVRVARLVAEQDETQHPSHGHGAYDPEADCKLVEIEIIAPPQKTQQWGGSSRRTGLVERTPGASGVRATAARPRAKKIQRQRGRNTRQP
jgi:hypothetical protein